MTKAPSVGVGVLVTCGGRILLLRQINAHEVVSWSIHGWHLEIGENPEACIICETKDETSPVIGKVHFLASFYSWFPHENLSLIYKNNLLTSVCEMVGNMEVFKTLTKFSSFYQIRRPMPPSAVLPRQLYRTRARC
jgi:hypothetical protein